MAISPIRPDSVTDAQLAAMRQAVGRVGDEPWAGDMGPAMECCDRGWLSIAHLPDNVQTGRDGVFYLITASGAAVLRRAQARQ